MVGDVGVGGDIGIGGAIGIGGIGGVVPGEAAILA
jgi:hypothetical protein